MTIRTPGNEQRQTFHQVDHFAGQIAYFSDCIAEHVAPEADGEEGLADMRVLLAIDKAASTGETVQLEPRAFGRGLDAEMVRCFAVTDRRLLV
jgi:predicted dehydrogenase